jgi:hypothetical protein
MPQTLDEYFLQIKMNLDDDQREDQLKAIENKKYEAA